MEHHGDRVALEYHSLDNDKNEIRLMTLLPEDNEGVVKCTFEHVSLINPTEFCALSYYCKQPGPVSFFLPLL